MKTTFEDCPIVTVGIPVVKAEFLKSAIDSCLFQTYTNLEIIILNNAKTEKIGNEIEYIISQYEDKRINYFRNLQQLPMIQNWNKIVEMATGEYFSILCDDDEWHTDFLNSMVKLSKKYINTDVFHSRVLIEYLYKNDKIIDLSNLCNEFEDTLDFILHRVKGCRQQYLSDFMVRLNTLKKIGGFVDLPDGWGSDDLTWFLIAAEGDGVAYESRPLFTYRNHGESVTNNYNVKNKLKSVDQYCINLNELLRKINLDTPTKKIKQKIIQNELLNYKKQNRHSLIKKKLLFNKRIPNSIVPFLFLLQRKYDDYQISLKNEK